MLSGDITFLSLISFLWSILEFNLLFQNCNVSIVDKSSLYLQPNNSKEIRTMINVKKLRQDARREGREYTTRRGKKIEAWEPPMKQ